MTSPSKRKKAAKAARRRLERERDDARSSAVIYESKPGGKAEIGKAGEVSRFVAAELRGLHRSIKR